MRNAVFGWVLHHGYLGLSSLLMLGIVGVPVPDETLLLFTGYLVYRGDLHLVPAVAAAFAGSAVGITVSYAIGRALGHRAIVRYGSYFHLTHERMERVSRWYAHGGNWTLTVGYFVPGFRHVAALVAGASGVSVRTLIAFAYPGAIAWVTTFIMAGKTFGAQWQWAADEFQSHVKLGVAALAALVVLGWLFHRLISRKWGH